MYERYSIHYHSVFFPLTKTNNSSISRQIQENQKLMHLYISYYDNRFYTAIASEAVASIKSMGYDKYYYYHTRNNDTNQEEAQVFITYEELKDEIDKDLARHKKNISAALGEVKDASSEETITPWNPYYTARTNPYGRWIAEFVDRIETGDIWVRVPENIWDTTRAVRDCSFNRQVGALDNDNRRFNERVAQLNNINTVTRNNRVTIDHHTWHITLPEWENPFDGLDPDPVNN